MKHILVSKALQTRARSGFYNHTAYVKGKELVIFDWASRAKDPEAVLNDKTLREKLVQDFGYDVSDDNIVNMLVAVEVKTGLPYLVHSKELSHYESTTEEFGL